MSAKIIQFDKLNRTPLSDEKALQELKDYIENEIVGTLSITPEQVLNLTSYSLYIPKTALPKEEE